MKKMSTQMIVEAGVMLALAQILSYIKVVEFPAGGSVTAASMVPIVFFAIRWGTKNGIVMGATFGILQMVLGKIWSFNIISLLLDYPVAFGALGLAGLIRTSIPGNIISIIIAMTGRFLSHLVSGVLVFASSWGASFSYNISYMLPELIITIVVIGFLYKPLNKALNSRQSA